VSKPLATNSASKKAKNITASVEDCPYFKKIRNKLKFVGASKAVLETGKVSAESNCSLLVEFCWSMIPK
jgi:Asp-tRNA(Asn)/Glu-tRNA(Gln) amidotransferase B subunit